MSIDFESLKDKAVVFAQSGVTKAKELTDTGIAKAKEISEIGKLKVQNSTEQEAIRKAYSELGKLYYAERGSAPEAAYADLCQRITDALARISYNNERMRKSRPWGPRRRPRSPAAATRRRPRTTSPRSKIPYEKAPQSYDCGAFWLDQSPASASKRSMGKGGKATGFMAMDSSFLGVSSAATRLEDSVPHRRQRWMIAHSPPLRTHTAMGSITPPQSEARSPGSTSTWRLDRQLGQWFRWLLPAPWGKTDQPQVRQVKDSRQGRVL